MKSCYFFGGCAKNSAAFSLRLYIFFVAPTCALRDAACVVVGKSRRKHTRKKCFLQEFHSSNNPSISHRAQPSANFILRSPPSRACPTFVQAMVALVLADALMQHKAQCDLFPPGTLDSLDSNPLGKQLSVGVGANL